jgi:hypothetical protein
MGGWVKPPPPAGVAVTPGVGPPIVPGPPNKHPDAPGTVGSYGNGIQITNLDQPFCVEVHDLQPWVQYLMAEGENPSSYSTINLAAPTTLLILDGEGVAETLIQLTHHAMMRAYNFGSGLTCDTYMYLEDGSNEVVVLGNEPAEIELPEIPVQFEDVMASDILRLYLQHKPDHLIMHM